MGENKGMRWPERIIAAAILGVSLVLCTVIAAGTWAKQRSTLTVTGAAAKELRSDLAVWNFSFVRRSADRAEALAALNKDLQAVRDFLQAGGIPAGEITVAPVTVSTMYQVDEHGRETNQVQAYIASQSVEVKSKDVDRVTSVFRNTGELITRGVDLQAAPPQYFYTKLDELKIEMLAEATKNARQRAEQIATSGGSKLGPLRLAQMGVFQITPVNSTEVSDYGINDTSSLEKKITAVVKAEFYVQ